MTGGIHENNLQEIDNGAELYLLEYSDGVYRIIISDDPCDSFRIVLDGVDTVLIEEN